MKRAILYYSLSGNTKEAAELLANELNAELYELKLVKPMPKKVSQQMFLGGMQATFAMTPKILGVPGNIASYDEIILGLPVWAGKPASPIQTLLKQYPIADKITKVFTCSGSGNNKHCIAVLQKRLPHLKVTVSLTDRSSKTAGDNQRKLKAFLEAIQA